MDSSALRIVLALVFVTVIVTEAANAKPAARTRRQTILGFPRIGRGYLALPRMGRSSPSGQEFLGFGRNSRGYLALPRMGRSSQTGTGNSGSDDTDSSASGGSSADGSCCKVGLKKEWLMGEDGQMAPKDVCQGAEFCCPDLEEVQDNKPDGSFYTMCVPKCWANNEDGASEKVMLKLRQMLQN